MKGDAPTRPPALTIECFSITLPDGSKLIDNARLDIAGGEFVLLVGRSGSGKTTLLRRIAGLEEDAVDGLQYEGNILIGNQSFSGRRRVPVGLVFQNHALFDELSARLNVQFAIDHRPIASHDSQKAKRLLERLRVPDRARLSMLSGGERQRVAVARTLAMDPPILLFDEPTTGLDPGRAAAVAELIVETHRQFGKTVIVVTHDFSPFLRHHPRIILLDDVSRSLRSTDEQGLRSHFQVDRLEADHVDSSVRIPNAAPRRSRWLRWLEASGLPLMLLITAIAAPWPGWRRPTWQMRYLWHYLRMVAFGATALYVAIAGLMLGFVFITFSFSNLPYSRVTVPLLTEEFLAATGYSMFRVVVPLMIAVLIAGKCGASVAADLGARRLTFQYEAMRSMGASPRNYLFGNIVLSLALAGPLLTLVAFSCSWYAAMIGFLTSVPEATVSSFRRNFFATLLLAGQGFPVGTGWVMLKSTTTGLVIAAIAYAIGSRPKTSAVDVSRDVGLTIFWSSLGVLLLHALYSFVEF